MRRTVVSICAFGMVAAVIGLAPAAQAKRDCPSAGVGGRTVAWITVGSTKVPIKRVPFRRGQPLNPPATNQAAGLSLGHAPLGAREGTTVLTWHVRFGSGCYGTLNPLLKEPIGSTFTVQPVGKEPKQYRIVSREEVRKGRYRAAWFRQTGPHQLALFTCADLRGGTYRNTAVILATPVEGEIPVTDQPDPGIVVTAPDASPAAPPAPAPAPTPTPTG